MHQWQCLPTWITKVWQWIGFLAARHTTSWLNLILDNSKAADKGFFFLPVDVARVTSFSFTCPSQVLVLLQQHKQCCMYVSSFISEPQREMFYVKVHLWRTDGTKLETVNATWPPMWVIHWTEMNSRCLACFLLQLSESDMNGCKWVWEMNQSTVCWIQYWLWINLV